MPSTKTESSGKAGHILIVEDSKIQATALTYYLENYGYEVVWAKNGKEALGLLANSEFETVMTDVQMPEMDGMELLTEIRKNSKTQSLPVVVMTSMSEQEVCIMALKLGATEFLTKPVQKEEIGLRAKNLINLYRTEKKNRDLLNTISNKNKLLEENLINLKKAQNQLVQTSKMSSLGVMGGGIAHEINTPLAAVSMSSDLINDIVKSSDVDIKQIDELNANIKLASDKMAKIVNHIRIFSRTTDHSTKQILDLNVLISNLDHFYGEYANQQKIEIIKKIPTQPQKILANSIAIENVFLNIIQNAIDSMINSSIKRITISIFSENEKAIVEISDTGHGIPAEIIEKIYDPFFTTREPSKGVGLGLSVVQTYLTESSAGIQCQSTNLGTTFKVIFPLVK